MLVVFDLDGTLVDSRRDLADAANELLDGYGAPPLTEDAVGRMVGEGAGVLVTRVLAARGLEVPHAEALDHYLAIYDRRLLDHTVPYEGIPDALDAIGTWARLATLTNKPSCATGRLLEALGLARHFEWVVGGDSPHGRKPSPAGLEWLMHAAAVDPARTVMVGDSSTDVLTARHARARACVARYGFGFLNMPAGVLDGSELVVDRAADLPEVLRAVRAVTP